MSDGVTLRGDDLGRIIAILKDDSSLCVLVDIGMKSAPSSCHFSTWCNATTKRAMWHIHEVDLCAAWLEKGDKVTVIFR